MGLGMELVCAPGEFLAKLQEWLQRFPIHFPQYSAHQKTAGNSTTLGTSPRLEAGNQFWEKVLA